MDKIRIIIGSVFTLFGLFMAVSTFQVAKDFVFQNYFRIDASIIIRIVFLGVMFLLTFYLIKIGITIFGFLPGRQNPTTNKDS